MAEIILTPELIEEFLAGREREGIALTSLEVYRRNLKKLYDCLPEGKRLTAETGGAWKEQIDRKSVV